MAIPRASLVLATAGAVALVVVAWRASEYFFARDPCESIFQQTQSTITAKLSVVKAAGEIVLAKQKVQELSESAQNLAVTLKGCCVVVGAQVSAAEFLRCQEGVRNEENRIDRIVALIGEARSLRPDGVAEKAREATRLAEEIKAGAVLLDRSVKEIAKSRPPAPRKDERATARDAEREPNDDRFNANIVPFGATVNGAIADRADADWFGFTATTKVRDWMSVKLANRSTSLDPYIAVYHADQKLIAEAYGGTGADTELRFTVDPGQQYLVEVRSFGRNAVGAYALSLVALKAHDAFEPNDSTKQATPIKIGQPVEASILDERDSDWYRVGGFASKRLVLRVENLSETLAPQLDVRNHLHDAVGPSPFAFAATPGASLEREVEVELGKEYFVGVSRFVGTGGKYRLVVEEKR